MFFLKKKKKKTLLSYLCVLVAQSCPTLCNSMEPTRLLCSWDFSGKNIGVGCHFLLHEILPMKESNPELRTAGKLFTVWATKEALSGIYKFTTTHNFMCLNFHLPRSEVFNFWKVSQDPFTLLKTDTLTGFLIHSFTWIIYLLGFYHIRVQNIKNKNLKIF